LATPRCAIRCPAGYISLTGARLRGRLQQLAVS
jgi:hypothetical protein